MMKSPGQERAEVPGRSLPGVMVMLAIIGAIAVAIALGGPAGAYDQYSINRTTGNCAACHGDFRASTYSSLNDGVAWGQSLHNGHRQTMLSGDCDVCHEASRFPVSLSLSNGGAGFDPIGCLGCHGRAEPAAGGAVRGSGLRQHHYRTGVTLCGNAGCHTDANPATFTPAGEDVKPPYYFTPDASHPGKPTESCNGNGSESLVAAPLGLDNDGDNQYDGSDSNCGSVGVGDRAGFALSLAGARPNPSAGRFRVVFSLPTAASAVLEVFDVNGRRIVSREVGSMGPGRHVVEMAAARPLSPGVYMLRLTQAQRSLSARAVVMN